VSERSKFWLVSIITFIAVGVTLSMGFWQMSRADAKEQMQASVEQRGLLDKLDAGVLLANAPLETVLNRYIAVRGRWLSDQMVFLDNRQMSGRVGFLVLTPLQFEGRAEAVLVQRGWAPRNFVDRAQLPRIDTPAGVVEVSGRIVAQPSKLYELGRSEAGPIRQNLDLARFGMEIKVPLLAASIQQTGAADDGLLRDWPAPSAGSEKNYGYAFQWFGLSALLAILYVWFQIVRRFFKQSRA
jgi:surfeit locus 1 family protein